MLGDAFSLFLDVEKVYSTDGTSKCVGISLNATALVKMRLFAIYVASPAVGASVRRVTAGVVFTIRESKRGEMSPNKTSCS